MCNRSLFKWWCHLHYWRNNSQRQFKHRKFDANLWNPSSPKLLENSWILHTNSPLVRVIKVCSDAGATNIIGKIIGKDNFNIEYLMKTFENLLVQNRHLHFWRNNSQRRFEQRKFDANLWKSSSPQLLNKILRYCT